jgi:hypothetical protein
VKQGDVLLSQSEIFRPQMPRRDTMLWPVCLSFRPSPKRPPSTIQRRMRRSRRTPGNPTSADVHSRNRLAVVAHAGGVLGPVSRGWRRQPVQNKTSANRSSLAKSTGAVMSEMLSFRRPRLVSHNF